MRVNLPITGEEFVLADDDQIVSRTDLDSHITYVNDAFCLASGFDREELLGQPQNVVRHPDMPAAAFADLWQTIQGGEPWTGIIKNRRKDGGYYWVRANVTPIFESGQLAGYMSVRTKPTRQEIREAEALYQELAQDHPRRRLHFGQVRHQGLRGGLMSAHDVSFDTRCWLTSVGFFVLFGAMALLALSQPSGGARTAMLLLGGLGMLTSISFGIWCAAELTGPLRRALATARLVVGGELKHDFDVSGDPELGKLFMQINQIKRNLHGVMVDVHQRARNVDEAARQIAAGNLDLSARTEQQAASLEETASSMEELQATVQQNSDHARDAHDKATEASGVADQAGQVMREVVNTMNGIDQASRQMAGIIGLIDNIAFQTNMLALNAAVEAARAGEQGRGFAVVANEVGNLARRSAEAAKEIRGLIDNSVSRIEAGSALATQAGETVTRMAEAVQDVTHIMAEIASASDQQRAGVEQINKAVSQMDQVTQRNAALVEQLAATATELEHQTTQVHDAMAMFERGAIRGLNPDRPRLLRPNGTVQSHSSRTPQNPSSGQSRAA